MLEDPMWSSNPAVSRVLSDETQPSPRLMIRPPASRRKPVGIYILTACLALVVAACALTSILLAAIGPSTLLALRDRWLGRNLTETISTVSQVAKVIITNDNDVWPVPGTGSPALHSARSIRAFARL